MSLTRGQTSPYLDMMKANVADLSVDIIERSGHYPQIERPAATNAAIDAFLKGLA